MRGASVWARLLGVEGVVIDGVDLEDRGGDECQVVVSTRIRKQRHRQRCPHCQRRCPRYDKGEGRRRWRALDVGVVPVYIEADAPRVRCEEHGVVVAWVPWARHGAAFTRDFEDQTAWLTARTDRTTVSQLMRIAWKTAGRIVERVSDEMTRRVDLFAGVRRIGIDEVSFRKGHRYLTVVVDHDSGRMLWAKVGRNEATLHQFFDLLGPTRSAQIELVSADAAAWIRNVVAARCPRATLCLDPFHIVQWATEALDAVRRSTWNDLRRAGHGALAKQLKNARYALWKNPEDLTEKQRGKLAYIQTANRPLYRAYLLKEQLREVFKLRGAAGMQLLNLWLDWAQRCQLPAFVRLAQRIRAHREGIDAALTHGLSNARVEAANTKVRLLTRLAYGFHSATALIGLVMLKLGGLCPALPGRTDPRRC